MKSEESMAGEDSELAGTCFELAGTHVTIGKNKIPMKIPEFKRSGIRIIAEFRRIPSGFPNQGSGSLANSKCCHYIMVEVDSHLKLLLSFK
jgi:hypothetical protein